MEPRESWEAWAPGRYVERHVAQAAARAEAPVVVLEGASGVGKTELVRNEPAFTQHTYVSLADEAAFAQASAQPREWVAGLARPVVIDDAHRVPGLLDAVRALAAEEKAPARAFVLVGSQRFCCEEGEEAPGPEPTRFTVFPLTQAELRGRTTSVVDSLFDAPIAPRFYSPYTRSDLRTILRIGGFPARVAHPARSLSPAGRHAMPFREELDLLSEGDIGPEVAIDQLLKRDILGLALGEPGLSLGVEAAAFTCCTDVPTFAAHMAEYRNRFLIHRLIMLDRKKPTDTAFAKTRIHPIDTAIAVEGLRSMGCDIASDPMAFSRALRTFCVGQLAAAAEWASEPTECRHWKKFTRRLHQVDLVLVRGNRLVGISVRNSLDARPETIGALRFLAKDERFERGFIIYMGRRSRQVADNIWAIPVSALWEEGAFGVGQAGETLEAIDDLELAEELGL